METSLLAYVTINTNDSRTGFLSWASFFHNNYITTEQVLRDKIEEPRSKQKTIIR